MPVHDYIIMLWIRSGLLTYNMNDYVAMRHFFSSFLIVMAGSEHHQYQATR